MSKPTTSDMTVEQILDKMLNDTLDYVERMEKVNSPVLFLGKYKAEALAAIEAHYAAKQEVVIQERDVQWVKAIRHHILENNQDMDVKRIEADMERLNNTEEKV